MDRRNPVATVTGPEDAPTDSPALEDGAAGYWQLNWPDDDDDVAFFPHLDLESEEMAEAEEDATRL